MQYHMTLNLTTDIQLQLGFSLKLDQLQKNATHQSWMP